MVTKNEVPASVGKQSIEKTNKAGAKGMQLGGTKGKTSNAARTMRRARKIFEAQQMAHVLLDKNPNEPATAKKRNTFST